MGHFGSEENHGGYLGQDRRFRHFKQVRILKGVVGDYGHRGGHLRGVSLGPGTWMGIIWLYLVLTLSFTEIFFFVIF